MQTLASLDGLRGVQLCSADVVTYIATVSVCKRANGGKALVLLDEMRGFQLSSANVVTYIATASAARLIP